MVMEEDFKQRVRDWYAEAARSVLGEGSGRRICVCKFARYFDAGQSKVSYHLGKLKAAGLVHEERCGKWSCYSLDREAAGRLLAETAAHLDGSPRNDG
jgi:DNA-binding transcriptional ArsR family regulator